MRMFPPDFIMHAELKLYMAGDQRRNNENNTDDRNRTSRIHFDLRDLKLQPLQRERFIFLLGPRYDPENPHKIKIVTKQYPTHLENYFKGLETIKEMYWEALRAPDDQVNFQRDPYLREQFKKRKLGKTREQRLATKAMLKESYVARVKEVEEQEQREAQNGVGTPRENLAQKREIAKARKLLGFLDNEVTEEGETISAEDGLGVQDKVLEDLNIRRTKYEKQVQEQRARKEINIVTPVQGISKAEWKEGMLRSDEHFQKV